MYDSLREDQQLRPDHFVCMQSELLLLFPLGISSVFFKLFVGPAVTQAVAPAVTGLRQNIPAFSNSISKDPADGWEVF
jgi:hypothetical protein